MFQTYGHFYSRIAFVCGIILGIVLAVILSNILGPHEKVDLAKEFCKRNDYNKWFQDKKLSKKQLLWDNIRYENKSYFLESEFLYETIKVRCVVLVKNEKNVQAAKDTWMKGCNDIKLIYLKEKDKVLPRKRTKDESPWILLCKILNELDAIDWTFIVYDYTFVIVENFRYYVAALNANDEYYLGHAVKFWGIVYNDGQAGYALSKGALKKFKKYVDSKKCEEIIYWNKEDYYLGKYLNSMNISAINTQDVNGLSTFHPYNWYKMFFNGQISAFPTRCCSDRAITFQAIEGDKMYTYYYLLYQLQIFNGGNLGNIPPKYVPDENIWREFAKQRNIIKNDISGKEYYKIWEDYIDDPSSFAKNMKRENNLDL